MRSSIALQILAIAFAATCANSQTVGLGFLIGGSKLQGDIEQSGMAPTFGAVLRYNPVSFFGLSVHSSYGKMTSGLEALKTKIITFNLSGNFFLLPRSRIRPFVTLGLSNIYFAALDGDNHQLYYADGSALAGWEQAMQVGVGFELFASNHWAITTSWDYTRAPRDDLEGIKQGANDAFFRGLLGLTYYLVPRVRKEERLAEEARVEVEETVADDTPSEPELEPDSSPNQQSSNGIEFVPGTDELQQDSKKQLQRIYYYLRANPDEEIELFSGSTADPNNLHLRRAKAVKAYLESLGIDAKRIIIRSPDD